MKPDKPSDKIPTSDSLVKVATFNTGLARNFVGYAEARLDPIAKALSDLDADVICLQEVWEANDFLWIEEATRDRFPHSLYESVGDPGKRSRPSCTKKDLEPLLGCVQEHCSDASNLSACVMKHCLKVLNQITPECRKCLAVNVSKPLDQIAELCLQGTPEYAYDGRNGLAILSRFPLKNSGRIDLPSYFIRRAALQAEVELPGGPVRVFCTHLSTPLSEVPYQGKHQTWKDEQRSQISTLIETISSQGEGVPTVLAGDFNCGPDIEGAPGEFPEHFQLFLDGGWQSPYLDTNPVRCTFCADNPLVTESSDKLLDHVLLLNFPRSRFQREGVRIFDQPVELETSQGKQSLPLSDHYGVQIQQPAYP